MISRICRRTILVALAAFALTAPATLEARARPITVFAAASLKNVLDDVGVAYTAATGRPVVFSYGASSAIARQIESAAPADIFISADADWMDYVQKRGLIVQGSRRNLLTNHLVLIAPASSKIQLRIAKGMPLARALGGGRLAVAEPEVPAGRYAKDSLVALGVWDSVAGKLAPAENVRAALQFVAQGQTPLGIVYDTDAKVEPKVRIVGLFSDASHPPIVYPAALVAASKNAEAKAFLAFLRGPRAAVVFRRYGFIVLR